MLKTATVLPLHKQGDLNDPNNYRPISLVPMFSKIYEKLLCDQLVDYFEGRRLFSEHQYGFRRGCSTNDAILQLTSEILESFNKNVFHASCFIDLSKAFDCVNHDILLNKIQKYGIDNNGCLLIRSF